MRRIAIYLILLGIISANAELRTPIKAEKVDSVIIRTIDWSVMSFGHYGIDRKAFDKLYEFLLTDSIFREKEGMSVDSIIIKDDISKFLAGFKMMYASLTETLKRFGVEEINRVGQIFDPSQEQALLTDCVEDAEDEVVLEVLLKGYKLKDRVIRPASVKINQK